MNSHTVELLQTMRQQALNVLNANNRHRHQATAFEVAYARGQLSVLRLLEEGSEHDIENTRRSFETLY